MKERPILFNSPMVRKVLNDTKLQTRRIVRWRDLTPGLNLSFTGLKPYSYAPGLFTLEAPTRNGWERRSGATRCPYGLPGDRLWVRETWCQQADEDGHLIDAYWYRATTPDVVHTDDQEKSPWRPSIHMPRAACRITLEVTGVRVERLQDISEADAKAEGATPDPCDHSRLTCEEIGCSGPDYLSGFRTLWQSINGQDSWGANPWVWAVTFKQLEQAA